MWNFHRYLLTWLPFMWHTVFVCMCRSVWVGGGANPPCAKHQCLGGLNRRMIVILPSDMMDMRLLVWLHWVWSLTSHVDQISFVLCMNLKAYKWGKDENTRIQKKKHTHPSCALLTDLYGVTCCQHGQTRFGAHVLCLSTSTLLSLPALFLFSPFRTLFSFVHLSSCHSNKKTCWSLYVMGLYVSVLPRLCTSMQHWRSF